MQIEEIVDEIHDDAHNRGRNDVLYDDIGVNDIARMAVDEKQVQGGSDADVGYSRIGCAGDAEGRNSD